MIYVKPLFTTLCVLQHKNNGVDLFPQYAQGDVSITNEWYGLRRPGHGTRRHNNFCHNCTHASTVLDILLVVLMCLLHFPLREMVSAKSTCETMDDEEEE